MNIYKWKLFFLLLVVMFQPIFANAYWYIQIGAYQDKIEAIKAMDYNIGELEMKGGYNKERQETNYMHLHQQDGFYKLLIGPYAEKEHAGKWRDKMPEESFFISVDKDYYDNFKIAERFVTKEVPFESYFLKKKEQNLGETLHPMLTDYSFIQYSYDKSYRFSEKNGQFYIEKCNRSECISVYHLNQDFDGVHISVATDSLSWSLDNEIFLYIYDRGKASYDFKNAYKISRVQDEFQVQSIPAYEQEEMRKKISYIT